MNNALIGLCQLAVQLQQSQLSRRVQAAEGCVAGREEDFHFTPP